MPCPSDHPTDSAWREFAAGRLAEDEIRRLAEHLESCVRCLERLNGAHAAGDAFEEKLKALATATDDREGLDGEVQPSADQPGHANRIAQRAAQYEPSGTIVGRYKLLQVIGEGGMGVVYMAEQLEPVRRRVALKIIKPGMDSRQVIARFEAERQALAMMDHENITRVLDAGATDHGYPYFATELIRGIPITEFCAKHRLTLRERLELFIPVCQAIQHAHQKGIIHRDIKPSNILVTHYDGRPVPKVIDFGVAKAIGQPLTERTMFTRYGQVIGTLEYMSPEQSELSQLDVDTRSDIYSLGVLLYELLTGTTPIDRRRIGKSSFDEILRVIREEEPERPSTRLSASGVVPPAEFRPERARWASQLRGELDWIVMKALEKDRSRRYATANGLAADVRRYLRNEPVEAGPPSAFYRLSKLALKYRAALAVLLAFIGLLIVGATISVYSAFHATQATALARNAKERADKALANEAVQRRRAEALAAESHARLVRLYIATGSNAAQVEDWPTALLWYAKAWGVDKSQAIPDVNHRQRFAAVIDRLRRPSAIGFSDGMVLHAQCQGSLLLTRTVDRAELWRLPSCERLAMPDLPTGKLHDVELSADGRIVAVAIEDQVRYWRPDDVASVLSLAHPALVNSVAISADGTTLATACEDGRIRFWQAADGSPAPPPPIECALEPLHVQFAPRGDSVVVVDRDERALLYRIESGEGFGESMPHRLRPGNPADDLFQSPEFSPDGAKLLTIHGRMLHIWDAAAGVRVLKPVDVGFNLNGARWTSASDQVLVYGQATGSYIVDVGRGAIVKQLGHPREVQGGCVHPSRPLAATGSSAGLVHLWDLSGELPHETVVGRHCGNVLRMTFTPEGNHLITAGQDGTIRVWPLESPAAAQHPYAFDCGQAHQLTRQRDVDGAYLAVSPDGRDAARYGRDLGAVIVSRGSSGGREIALEHDERLALVKYCASGERLVTIGDQSVMVWNARDGGRAGGPWELEHPPQTAWLSHDGNVVAIFDSEKSVLVWDARTGQRLLGPLQELSVPADAAMFVGGMSNSSDWDGTIRVGDLDPGGRRIVLAARRFARVIDLTTGAELVFTTHSGFFASARFNPVGTQVVFAGSDRTARVWDALNGQPISPPMRHPSFARYAAFSPDGLRVVSSGSGGRISVWDARSGDLLVPPLPAPWSEAGLVWFSQDGRRVIASANEQVTVAQWTLPSLRSPVEMVPKIVHLLTGHEVDATDGIVTVDRNRVRGDVAGYEAAWRSLAGR